MIDQKEGLLEVDVSSAESLHVSRVAKVLSRLISSFIGSHLKADHLFSCSQLFFRELSDVNIGRLGSKERSRPLGVSVARSSESHDALSHLRDVPSLPQIYCLEDIDLRNSELLGRSLEGIDVLHQFEVGSCLIDLAH